MGTPLAGGRNDARKSISLEVFDTAYKWKICSPPVVWTLLYVRSVNRRAVVHAVNKCLTPDRGRLGRYLMNVGIIKQAQIRVSQR